MVNENSSSSFSSPSSTAASALVEIRSDSHGGKGLFARRAITVNTLILSVGGDNVDGDNNTFAATALDEDRLRDSCSCCFAQIGRGTEALKLCAGCKAVRYCSTACQKRSWTADGHRLECRIFRRLAPRILPGSVRLVLRLLLLESGATTATATGVGDGDGNRNGNGNGTAETQMNSILKLNDHLVEFRQADGQRWENLCLGAKAAMMYSGTRKYDDATVLRLFGILLTNSFTLVTSTYDPIGVALHPDLAYMNHSCEANATVRFGKYGFAEVVPLRAIAEGEEILILYVDELTPRRERRAELKERYLFDCHCPRCVRESSMTVFPPFSSATAKENYDSAVVLLNSQSNDLESLTIALKNLHDISPSCSSSSSWVPTRYPMPSLRQQLITAYLDRGNHMLAFIHAMIQSFQLDPILYLPSYHPIRMVHAWLCVRIIDEILESDSRTGSEQPININIDLLFWRSALLVSLRRSTTVGPVGEFSEMVRVRYEEDFHSWQAAGGATEFLASAKSGIKTVGRVKSVSSSGNNNNESAYQEPYTRRELLEKRWRPVQKAIDLVTEWERVGNDKGSELMLSSEADAEAGC